MSQSRLSVLNYDEVSNVLNDEINIFSVLKTKHNTTRPNQNIVENACQPPVVGNNSPEN